MSRTRCAAAFLAVTMLAATAATAQTTGSVVGRVDVKTGGGLPLVSVEAKGPSLQGSRTAVTDSQGRYKLSLLPPGTYDLTFTKQGFGAETRSGIVVQLDRDTSLDLSLRATVEEAVTVIAEAPAIDVASNRLGVGFDTT